MAAGLSALAFPPLFLELVAIYFLGGLGYLWRALDEKGRQRLKEFEKAVRVPYERDKAGNTAEALAGYRKLALDYQDTPPILQIILGRIEEMEKRLSFGTVRGAKRRRRGRKKT